MQRISEGKAEGTLENQEGRKNQQFNDQLQISEIILLAYFLSLLL